MNLVVDCSLIPPCPEVPGLPIFRCISGSHAYGMSTPESDIDIRGVFVPSLDYLLGFMKRVQQIEVSRSSEFVMLTELLGESGVVTLDANDMVSKRTKKPDGADDTETVVYAIQKFMGLACGANPNILELLYAPDNCIIDVHPLWEMLVEKRDLFLSRAACKSFVGYGYAQLGRVARHRRWLLSPPKKQPERTDFDLPPEPLMTREQRGAFYVVVAHLLREHPEMERVWEAIKSIIEAEKFPGWEGIVQKGGIPGAAMKPLQELTGVSDNFIAVLQREQAYHKAVDEWHKYQEWKAKRNPKRAALEAKWGADTKHLCHLARLISMGEEIMTKGTLTVHRPDAEQLRAVRERGIWIDGTQITIDKFDDILAWTKAKETKLFALYHSDACPLPKKPDTKALDKLCIEIVARATGIPHSMYCNLV